MNDSSPHLDTGPKPTKSFCMTGIHKVVAPPDKSTVDNSSFNDKTSCKNGTNSIGQLICSKRKMSLNSDLCFHCNDPGSLFCCEYCPIAFHLYCCYPKCQKLFTGAPWKCNHCKLKTEFADDSILNCFNLDSRITSCVPKNADQPSRHSVQIKNEDISSNLEESSTNECSSESVNTARILSETSEPNFSTKSSLTTSNACTNGVDSNYKALAVVCKIGRSTAYKNLRKHFENNFTITNAENSEHLKKMKMILKPIQSVHVPASIKDFYKNRPTLQKMAPSEENFYTNYNQLIKESNYTHPSKEHQREFLQSMLVFQYSLAEKLCADTFNLSENELERIRSTGKEEPEENSDDHLKNTNGGSKHVKNVENTNPFGLKISSNDDSFSSNSSNETLSALSDEEEETDSIHMAQRGQTVPSSTGDFALLNKLELRLVRLLALQRLQQLQFDPDQIKAYTCSPDLPLRKIDKYFGESFRSRAVLCPVVSKHPTRFRSKYSVELKPMLYRNFSFGTSKKCSLVLSEYGKCNYNSSKHAVIYYDEFSRQFELLNYSIYGTLVDNVFLSNDLQSDVPACNKTHTIENVGIEEFKDILWNKPTKSTTANHYKIKTFLVNDDSHYSKKKPKSPGKKKIVNDTFGEMNDLSAANREGPIKYSEVKFSESVVPVRKAKDWMTERLADSLEAKSLIISNVTGVLFKKNKSSVAQNRAERLKRRKMMNEAEKAKMPLFAMNAYADKPAWSPCKCDNVGHISQENQLNGWEGPIVLHHGSLVQIGCLQFVFGISKFGD